MASIGISSIARRRFFMVVVCLLALAPAAGAAAAGSVFIGGFDDLPLMPGMSERGGDLMVFDSPTGRIIENSTQGNVTKEAVLAFYQTTLPQLGWVRSGPGIFVREGEVLKLEFRPGPGGSPLTVHFILKPTDKEK